MSNNSKENTMEDKVDGRSREAKAAKARRSRTPFGVLRQKMALDADTMARIEKDDLVPRWINDDDHGQRIKNAESGGYDFVLSEGSEKVGDEDVDTSRKIKKLVGSHKDGSAKYAYLMAIPSKFYNEDQIAKEATNKQVDDSIRAGQPRGSDALGVSSDKASVSPQNIDYTP